MNFKNRTVITQTGTIRKDIYAVRPPEKVIYLNGECAYDIYGFTLNCEDVYLGTYRTEAHARIVVKGIRSKDMSILL